jgi:hypothetical protein
MLSNALSAYSSQNFDFDLTTSTGDKIHLDMGRQQSVAYSNDGSTETFSFERRDSLNIHIEGNGLDENDLEELRVALEAVAPELDAFINPQDELTQSLNKTAQSILNKLPIPVNPAQSDVIKSALATQADTLIPEVSLQEAGQNSIIQRATSILDELFYQLDNLDKQAFYA